MDKQRERRGMAMIFLCALMWSIAGVLIKFLPWNGLVIAGARSAIAGTVMFLYIRLSGHRLVVNRVSVTCGLLTSMMFLGFVMANKLTTSANAIVIQESAPAFVLLYGILFRRQRPRRMDVLAVALTLGGIALFFLDELSPGRMAGNLLALLTGVLVSIQYIVQCGAEENTCLSGILWAHLITALVGLPMAFVFDTPLNFQTLGAISLLGIVQLGIPYVLFGMSVRYCPPLAVSLLAMCEAIFNPIWVALVFGESPSPLALCGGVLVLATIALWAWLNGRTTKRGLSGTNG